ncbi:basement membrane-specific heparan sulfate proteoglycan core protein-like isoform X2 [Mya arenaria]|uniref:basement membrane-specific heparan sulfate proteoglycan core protein-like isoform X2 n=1 Tax=Mya arenaria TaxID=6604 RepID=UPI0022E31BC6|nr:basement membrane-specific heparan sulfate proteoglycan core protein-like isoform X2 [Mya arenaria]
MGPNLGLWTLILAFVALGYISSETEKDFEFAGEKTAQLSDDEDFLADQEGSGDIEGSGGAIAVPALYRARINITSLSFTAEIEAARDSRTINSLAITIQLQKAIEQILASLRGTIRIRIVDYEPGSLMVVFDVETDGSATEDEIVARLKEALSKGVINGNEVSLEGFQFDLVRTEPATCPAYFGTDPAPLPDIDRTIYGAKANIMVDNPFPCDGTIVAWRYYRIERVGTAYFGVFRPVEGGGHQIVNYTEIPEAEIGEQRVQLTNKINVIQGNYIGVFYDRGTQFGVVSNDISLSSSDRNDLYTNYVIAAYFEDLSSGTYYQNPYGYETTKAKFAIQAEMEYGGPVVVTAAPVVCTAEEWKCRSGECIPQEYRCDNQPDCFDKSDEEECDNLSNCAADEFRCKNLLVCLPPQFVCNFVDDCGDNSDEEQCGPGQVLITSYIESSSSNEYMLSWARPLMGSSDINNYSIKWRKVTVRDGQLTSQGNFIMEQAVSQFYQVVISSDKENHLITGLEPRTYYQVEIAANNEVGSSVPQAFIFKTADRGCEPGQFQCNNGGCIDNRFRCDDSPDCSDDSDEIGCNEIPTCPEGMMRCLLQDGSSKCVLASVGCACREDEFQCLDGRGCINFASICDGRDDCSDRSDEANCDCADGEFQCSSDRRCISNSLRCNSRPDCADSSDEANCPCRPDQYTCADGNCVEGNMRCDGVPQCEDRSDEFGCPCPPGSFTCTNTPTRECVDEGLRCDRTPDCSDGSDEQNCPTPTCGPGKWQCRDTSCVPESMRCDGRPQCEDGSDEDQCIATCRPDQYTCADGNCVEGNMRCDGVPQCEDRSDEFGCPRDDPPVANAGSDITVTYPSPIRLDGRRSSDDTRIVGYQWRRTDLSPGFFYSGEVIDITDLAPGTYDFVLTVEDDAGQTDSDNVSVTVNGCRSDQYTCADGNCVQANMRCDGVPQCEDRSDELNCPAKVCPDSDFQCKTVGILECVDKRLQCDGYPDCTDGSDEDGCPGCRRNEFECASDNRCISESSRCNGRIECADRSDELGCVCTEEQFRCGDGICIDLSQRCDQRVDCTDRSDELACPCRDGEFQCLNGDCVLESARCNGRSECRDLSDETNCPDRRRYPPCQDGFFQCGTGHCLQESRHCDGYPDCPDQSDERDCTLRCEAGEMECEVDRKCIPQAQICNRVYDCTDGRDELDCAVCSDREFQCESDRTCISAVGRCNGVKECSDGSDEMNCPPRPEVSVVISPRQLRIRAGAEAVFTCAVSGLPGARIQWYRQGGKDLPMQSAAEYNKLMIPVAKVMDSGVYVCRVRDSDQEYSDSAQLDVVQIGPDPDNGGDGGPCGKDEAVCQNGQCIRREYRCDGERDCSDGSDEPADCYNNLCEPNEFQCPSGQCVMKIWRCDGENDCDDGFDESNCRSKSPTEPCGFDEFQCVSGDQCIPLAYQCDQEIDCLDRSDEIGCSPPIITLPPVAEIEVELGGTFTIICEAVGVPTPLIVWRLNWGNIPSGDRVTTVSESGRGVLTVRDARYEDAGAYTCEAINNRGSIFAIPDALVIVTRQKGLCRPPFFNSAANTSDNCMRCFCFGHTIQCFSSDLSVSRIALANKPEFVREESGTQTPIESSLVNVNQRSGEYEVVDMTRNLPSGVYYWKLQREFLGDSLSSYGGELKYTIFYDIAGRRQSTLDVVDVIIKGNGITLYYRASVVPSPGVQTSISVPLIESAWQRADSTTIRGDTPVETLYADRGDLMMVLEDLEYILIRGSYDRQQTVSRIGGVFMSTAVEYQTEYGQAYLVEECSCPTGYVGMSCQNCADGFTRVQTGPYLGQCVACNCNGHSNDCDPYTGQCINCLHNTEGANCQICQDGYYGDARQGTPGDCRACPCPLTDPANQFSRSCFLERDGEVTCGNCPTGYEGRRCERCSEGYVGDPMTPGSSCTKTLVDYCDPRGSVQPQPNPITRRCDCKENTLGDRCDRCKGNSFYLSANYELGCVRCFCMGVSNVCQSTSWNRAQVSVSFTRDTSDVRITDMNGNALTAQQLTTDSANRELGFRGESTDTLYWALPQRFLGDRVSAYGGALRFTLNFRSANGAEVNPAEPLVKISGNDITLVHRVRLNMESQKPLAISIMMYEQNWYRLDGQPATREHLLMALADLDTMMIRATYEKPQAYAGLRDVSLDIAEDRSTRQDRAYPVEQCSCPVGYRGLSCEDCDTGYTRSGGGLYLGLCELCSCNGHSSECHPETGVCRNCQHNTAGDNCEMCAIGYYGDATRGSRIDCQQCPCPLTESPNQFSPTCELIRDSSNRGDVRCTACPVGHTGLRCESCLPGYTGNPMKVGDYCKLGPDVNCDCDTRGIVPNTQCDENTMQCQCKPYVQGRRCARCREDHFYLDANNPQGCLTCFCSGITNQCTSSSYYRDSLRPIIGTDGSHNFVLVNRRMNNLISDGFIVDSSRNSVTYNRFEGVQQERESLFFQLPAKFRGDRVTAYGGYLRFTLEFSVRPEGRMYRDVDLEIISQGQSARVYHLFEPALEVDRTQTYEILLRESSFNDLRSNTNPTRETFMKMLSDVEGILIRATYHQNMASVTLRDVSMDTAIPTPTGLGGAPMVEDCRCPEGYTGLSCERCADGYLRVSDGRDGLGRCVRCNCNKHATSCDPESGRCLDCQHNTEGDRCDRCMAGFYGVATAGTPNDCRPCPCPLTTRPNQFSSTCFLADDNQVTCDRCPTGYTGRQCGQCAEGYVGNPSEAGGSCRRQEEDRRPNVVVSPVRVEEPETSSVVFQCQVSGEGPFNVVWSRLDRRPLSDRANTSPRYSLTIRDLVRDDTGRYVCTATNRFGVTRREVELVVVGGRRPLQVRIDQTRIEVEEGRSARLVCSVVVSSAGEMYILSWSKQGGQMPAKAIDQNGVLVIPNIQRSDAGNYMCTGSDMFHVDEAVAVIIVKEDSAQSPTVRIEPRYLYVDEGNTVTFQCIASGSPPPRIEWYRGGNRELSPEATVTSDGTLRIPRAQLSDESDYYCKATNEHGSSELRTILYVRPISKPEITIIVRQTKYVVVAGDTARLECYAEDGSDRITLFWSRSTGLPVGATQNNGILTIPNVQPSYAGKYVCTGTDSETGIYSTAEAFLEVDVSPSVIAPTVKVEPEKVTIPMGTTGTLTCKATGNPQPTITWLKSREDLSSNHVVTGNTLRITQATMADRGIYVCRASNQAGTDQDWTIVEVERRMRPKIELYPNSTQRISVGSSALFQCRVMDGDPPPQVTWTRAGNLRMSERVEVMDNGVIMFKQAQQEDQGGYICSAQNEMGVITATATLYVEGPPTINIQPSKIIYAIIGQRVRLECSADGDPIPSVYWIEPSRSARGDVPVDESYDFSVAATPGSAVVDIGSFQRSDAGTYVCVAKNSGGQTQDRVQVSVDEGSRPRGLTISGPSTLSVREGQVVELICSASDINNPIIRWRRREGVLPPGHRVSAGVLTLPRFRSEYAGEYICSTVVQTQSYEASVIIIVTVAPRLTISPQRITSRAGDTVQLRCSASGSGPFNIEWSRVDAQMNPSARENDGILEIRQVTPADAGRYRCVVQSGSGTTEGYAIVDVAAPPSITVTQRDVYTETNKVAQLRCDTSGSPTPMVRWEREGGELPPQHRVQDGLLTIYNVQEQDAGRYICTATSTAGSARDYAVLHISSGSVIDGDNGGDRSNVQTVNIGDRVSLECIVTGTPLPTITWSRLDGRLPADSILGDGILIIPSAKMDDAGTYRCEAVNEAGSVSQNVVLYVRAEPRVTAPTNMRAALGESVSLVCDAQGFPAPAITWYRKDGEMPDDYQIVDGDLKISRVRPEDAGMYYCHAQNEHGDSDSPVNLNVGALVPRFTQDPKSYIAYPPLNDVYLDFDILLSLKPESTEGMVLYNGQFEDGGGDFVCFGLNEGYPEFKFDVGSGPAVIRGNNTLGLNEWHTIKLTRNRKKGSMVVDEEPAYTGESPGYFTGLDLAGNMYLGSVPNYNNIPKNTGYKDGFVGSISEVQIKGVELNLGAEALELHGIEQYNGCQRNPCLNGGECVAANMKFGFSCICPQGYTGSRCEERGEQCYPNACGPEGRCFNLPGRGGFRCICPLGRTGTGCLANVPVTSPYFNRTSFISYAPVDNVPFANNIELEFKPQSLQDGIIMYEGDNEDGSGDFLAIVQKDGYLEFRFDTGSGPAIVRSRNPVRVGEWTSIKASRNQREGSLTVNEEQPVKGSSPGSTIGLNLKLPLYLGGADPTVRVSPNTGVNQGFVGCVAQASINGARLELVRSAVESLNVVDCGERRLCERTPCRNGATCEDIPGPNYKCLCPVTHTGRDCEQELNLCLTNSPCQNGAACSYRDNTYQCDCPLGFAGRDCQFAIQLDDNLKFGGRSLLSLNQSLLAHTRTQERQNISFVIRTTQSDGLVFWQGAQADKKLMGQDYMSIALVDGYVEFRFEMGTGPAELRSRDRVNDGQPHMVFVDRLGRAGSLIIDSTETVFGNSQGSLQMLNVYGNIYFGGLSNIQLMTDNAHTENFEGCIGQINISGKDIDINRDVIRAFNIESCSNP